MEGASSASGMVFRWWVKCLPQRRALSIAKRLVEQGKAVSAIRYCRAILETDSGSVEARRTLAKACGAQGDPGTAVRMLKSAVPDARGESLAALVEVWVQRNDLHGATLILEEAVESSPDDQNLSCRLAEILLATNRPERAATVLARHQGKPKARRLMGLALIALGRAAEARQIFVRLHEEAPGSQSAYDVAVTEGYLGSDEAECWMEQAHSLDPDEVQATLALGVMRLRRGAWSDAELLLRRVSDRLPENALVHAYLALALHRLERSEEAAEECELALHFDPTLALAWYHYGLVEQKAGRHGVASEKFRRSIERDPKTAEYWSALGTSLYESSAYKDSVQAYRQALDIKPGDKRLFNNCGLAYRELGDFDSAVAAFREALRIDPEYVSAHSNLGLVAQDLGDLALALKCFADALRLDPGSEEARWFAAVVRLREGSYEQGWPDYEDRWLSAAARSVPFRFPEWKDESLSGKNVLVYGEQGLGDQIMFSSCIPQIGNSAGMVAVECSRKLETLFRRSFPDALVFGSATNDATMPEWFPRLPSVDYQVAIGSLPMRYRRNRSQFPQHEGYLRADPARIVYWRSRLEDCGPGPYVGVSWQGGAAGTRRALRSVPLSAFEGVFRRLGACYVSLQYTRCADEIESLKIQEGIAVHHWQQAIDDYDETAALVCALDLVISVCTSVIHLTGALGRPAVVLVPFAAEWRYGRAGAQMPWYPSIHLIRQSRPGAWDDVLERTVSQAGLLLAGHKVTSSVSRART